MFCFLSEYFHQKVLPLSATPSPECIAPSPKTEAAQQKVPSKLQSAGHSTIQLKAVAVKLKEIPLTVPQLNHVLSAPSETKEPLASPALKKIASEKATSNKKSPRKVIPTRGMCILLCMFENRLSTLHKRQWLCLINYKLMLFWKECIEQILDKQVLHTWLHDTCMCNWTFLVAEREFDPDKHCGVWVADQQKRCTRSLTCKVGYTESLQFDTTVVL